MISRNFKKDVLAVAILASCGQGWSGRRDIDWDLPCRTL